VMLAELRFTAAEFEREKRVVIEEIVMHHSFTLKPWFRGTPYYNTIGGYPETLHAITYDDIVRYHKMHYCRTCATIGVVCMRKYKGALSRLLDAKRSEAIVPTIDFNLGRKLGPENRLVLYKQPDEIGTLVYMTYPAFDSRAFVCKLVAWILKVRLIELLRHKLGLVYSVSVKQISQAHIGHLEIHFKSSVAPCSRMLALVKGEIRKLVRGISVADFEGYYHAYTQYLSNRRVHVDFVAYLTEQVVGRMYGVNSVYSTAYADFVAVCRAIFVPAACAFKIQTRSSKHIDGRV